MNQCPTCGKQMVRFEVRVGGQDLAMRSCSDCDTRRWERNGDEVDLTEVLDLTTDANPRREGPRARSRPR